MFQRAVSTWDSLRLSRLIKSLGSVMKSLQEQNSHSSCLWLRIYKYPATVSGWPGMSHTESCWGSHVYFYFRHGPYIVARPHLLVGLLHSFSFWFQLFPVLFCSSHLMCHVLPFTSSLCPFQSFFRLHMCFTCEVVPVDPSRCFSLTLIQYVCSVSPHQSCVFCVPRVRIPACVPSVSLVYTF